MDNPHKGRTGLDRLWFASRHTARGLVAAWRHESAFRQEIGLALVLLPAGWWLGHGWAERALLLGSVLLVLIVELLNSGIEAAIDRISLDLHELSGRAKDYGSAAVGLTLLLCAGIWGASLWSRFVS